MNDTSRLRSFLALGVSATAMICAAPAVAQVTNPATTPTSASDAPAPTPTQQARPQGGSLQDIVVTAQRRSEAIQDVPVAVSAFSGATLKAQRLDGGENLLQAVPNTNYSRSNFGGFNLAIRGIGEKVVSGAGVAGVSINENALPLNISNFANTDFYDTERVEVLRGPQGTLYGRNATGGAVNIITNKPTDTPGGSLTYEYGNYDSNKLTGFINAPITDTFAVRVAGFYLNRDGFGTNQYNGDKIDGRDLYSGRITAAWKPNDRFRAYLMYERYSEDDSRNRVGKQLCNSDPGPTSVAGVKVSSFQQGILSQGCQATSLYGSNVYQGPNSQPTTGGIFAGELGLQNTNAYAGFTEDHNLHDIDSSVDPRFSSKQNLIELNMQWDISDNLTLESITGYNRTHGYTVEDYQRDVATVPYNTTPTAGCFFCVAIPSYPLFYGATFPGGVVNDPQVGASNLFRVYDQTDGDSNERTQEFRLTSHFKGPLNFSAGVFGNDTTANTDYYVFFNPLTGLAQLLDNPLLGGQTNLSPYPIDQSGLPTVGGGHNYYQSRTDNRIQTYAAFGELYYQFNDQLKLTLGLRQTETRQYQQAFASPLFVAGPPGLSANPAQALNADATTGRINLDWTPHLSFTNQTLVYATYSRGYKDGGFNTPCQTANFSNNQGGCGYAFTYAPESINAYEVGTKNTLLGGSLVLNGDFFYYDYSNYQIATTVRKSSVNQNINANIYGVEVESIWQPINHLTLNGNLGYLHTEITGGNIVDDTNLTQGDPNLTHIQDGSGEGCVVNTGALAALLASTANLPLYAQQIALLGPSGSGQTGVCGGQYGNAGNPLAALYAYTNPNVQLAPQISGTGAGAYTTNVGQGVAVNLKGKELPNAPDLTVSIGAQYVFDISNDWRATLRGDYYWQDDSYARVFNAVNDKLKGYDVTNATLTFDQRAWGLNIQLFIKNAFNAQPITDTSVGSASSGLFYNTFTLDPRTYGVSLTKRF